MRKALVQGEAVEEDGDGFAHKSVSPAEIVEEEGCLSFPGVYVKIKRAEWVKIKAINEKGNAFELASDGYLGRCIQHELDHLNGITFFDRLSNLKRKMVEKKYKNMLKESDN